MMPTILLTRYRRVRCMAPAHDCWTFVRLDLESWLMPINESLLRAVDNLLKRAEAVGKFGKTADSNVMTQLVHDTRERIPAWYVELLVGFPLGGLEIAWQSDEPKEGYDGIAWMEWADPRCIRSESLECYPGLAILEKGWINVAGDSMGGGDPYFMPIDKGDNPPVYPGVP
jgi:hypothetical protein